MPKSKRKRLGCPKCERHKALTGEQLCPACRSRSTPSLIREINVILASNAKKLHEIATALDRCTKALLESRTPQDKILKRLGVKVN